MAYRPECIQGPKEEIQPALCPPESLCRPWNGCHSIAGSVYPLSALPAPSVLVNLPSILVCGGGSLSHDLHKPGSVHAR